MHVRPMNPAAALELIQWRYLPPYDMYNSPNDADEELVAFLNDPRNRYYRIEDDTGQLVAFCCFGYDAQVPGGSYDLSALDIGLGVRPDLTGQGRGKTFVASVCDFAEQTFAPAALRVTVAAWNERAQGVWQHAGFAPVERFNATHTGMGFVILSRNVRRSADRAT